MNITRRAAVARKIALFTSPPSLGMCLLLLTPRSMPHNVAGRISQKGLVAGKGLFTGVRGRWILETSALRSSRKFRCWGLGVLARHWPIVSHGGHHLNDGSTGRLRVAPLVHQRCERRPLHDTVHAIGRESGQIVLQIVPTGLLCACSDHRQRFVTQASQASRLGGRLWGGTKL